MQDQTAFRTAYGKVVAKAWEDAAYKGRLLDDPRTALSEAGIDVSDSAEIAVLEDSKDRRHFVLPAPPPEGEVGDAGLENAAGGFCCYCCCWV